MKKTLILALAALFAFSGSAFAAVTLGGNLSVEYSGDLATGLDNQGEELTLTLSAGEEGLWEMWVETANVLADSIELYEYEIKVTEDAFTAVAFQWDTDDGDEGDVSDPFEFMLASEDGTALRLSASLVGLDTTFQLEDGVLYSFGEVDVDDNTLGVGVATVWDPDRHYDVVGYGTLSVDPLTIDLAAASTGAAATDNTAFGVGVEVPVEDITLEGEYTVEQAYFDDGKTTWSLGATYEVGTMQVKGSYENAVDTGASDPATTLKGSVILSSDGNQKFADLFKTTKYYKNVGYAVKAAIESTTTDQADAAKIVTTLEGVTPAIPDTLWLYGKLALTSDSDDDVVAATTAAVESSSTGLVGRAYYKINDKLTSKTLVDYLGATSYTKTTFETGLTYAVTSDVDLTAKYNTVSETGEDVDNTVSVGVSVDF